MNINEEKYSDIIDLPRHQPDPIKHPRMSVYNRAAQFAPFAALTGYEESIEKASEEQVGKFQNNQPDECWP